MLFDISSKDFDFKLVEYPKDWDLISDDWLTLFHECSDPCVFYHPLFIKAADSLSTGGPTHLILGYQAGNLSIKAVNSLPTGAPTHLILGYQAGNFCFGLPIHLTKWRGLVHNIRVFDGGELCFDHLAPLDSTPDFIATQSFFETIHKSHSSLLFQGSSLENGFRKLLEKICLTERLHIFTRPITSCPYLSLPDNPEELLANLDNKFCPSLKRSIKRAQKEGIEFRILTSSDQTYSLADAFNNLIFVHADRFRYLKRKSNLLIMQQYFRRICELSKPFKDIIWFTEAIHQGEIIGSLFGFLTKHRYHFYQHGFASQYAKFSIGRLLMYHTMVELIKKNIFIFDFLRGMAAYKLDWTETIDDEYSVVLGFSALGKIALEWDRLLRSMKRNGNWEGLRYRFLNND